MTQPVNIIGPPFSGTTLLKKCLALLGIDTLETYSPPGPEPQFIHLIRHPWEVARFLQEETAGDLDQGHLIWLEDYRQAAQVSEKYHYLAIDYEKLLAEPLSVMKLIAKRFNLQYSCDLEKMYPLQLLELVKQEQRKFNFRKMPADHSTRYSVFYRLYDQKVIKEKTALSASLAALSPASGEEPPYMVRSIHHLSCTGGTIICKCLAAMHDVVLLSELHPLNPGAIIFNPFDPLQHYQIGYPAINYKAEADLQQFFMERLHLVVESCRWHQKALILRDHSHTDYLTSGISAKKHLLATLGNKYATRPLVTIRNPIDSYLSLQNNVEKKGWYTDVQSFDHYCCRVLHFISSYSDSEIFLYEDFVENPDRFLQKICASLDIRYNANYRQAFPNFQLTGDSGRGTSYKEIKKLSRRDYSPAFRDQIDSSKYFHILARRFGYS